MVKSKLARHAYEEGRRVSWKEVRVVQTVSDLCGVLSLKWSYHTTRRFWALLQRFVIRLEFLFLM